MKHGVDQPRKRVRSEPRAFDGTPPAMVGVAVGWAWNIRSIEDGCQLGVCAGAEWGAW